jgi:hypothetical protein
MKTKKHSDGIIPVRMVQCLCCKEDMLRVKYSHSMSIGRRLILDIEKLCKCSVPEASYCTWCDKAINDA